MSQALKLNQLQTTDDKIQQITQRLQEITEILSNDEVVQQAKQAVDDAEATLRPLKTSATNLELELEGTLNKSKATEERLYSGTVKNTKELEDMQQELASLKKRQDQLEETMLETMMAVEAAEADLQDKQAQLEKKRQAASHQNEALTTEQAHKTGELNQLQQQRDDIRADVAADELQRYDQLKARFRGGVVVAKMNMEGTCTYCGVRQTSILEKEVRRGNIAQCSNCQRILVF
jgi:uncharacterized protein